MKKASNKWNLRTGNTLRRLKVPRNKRKERYDTKGSYEAREFNPNKNKNWLLTHTNEGKEIVMCRTVMHFQQKWTRGLRTWKSATRKAIAYSTIDETKYHVLEFEDYNLLRRGFLTRTDRRLDKHVKRERIKKFHQRKRQWQATRMNDPQGEYEELFGV